MAGGLLHEVDCRPGPPPLLSAAVTEYQWLLLFHLLGAFLFLSGAVVAGILQLVAMRRQRPSEVALLLRLTRPAVLIVAIGTLAVLAFGIWLADERGYSLGDAWLAAALALWAVALALGAVGGRAARHARHLAERLAADGDRPHAELRHAVADPRALIVNYASVAAGLAILVLMIWKPGA